jgi:CBS domain-containing protein
MPAKGRTKLGFMDQKSLPQAFQISSKDIITIDIGDAVAAAHQVMIKNKIRHLVVTKDENAIGVLSDRDVMRAMRTDIKDFFSVRVREQSFVGDVRVGDVMGWPLHTVDQGAPLIELVEKMLQEKVSSLLVLSGGGVVGIVTTDDLLQVLSKILKTGKASDFEEQHPWLAEVYQSPIGQILGMLSNSGI